MASLDSRLTNGLRRHGLALAAGALLASVAACGGGASDLPQAASPASTPAPKRCDERVADEAGLATAYVSAQGGETICLEDGDYGTFRAATKPRTVTVRSAPGARARLKLELRDVANLRLERLTIRAATIGGTTHDLRIADSRFTGIAVVDAAQMHDANVVFERNTHADIDTCVTCYQGRLHIEGASGRPSGILVKDSVFSGGDSDGIRADADGIRIVGNEFFGFRDRDPLHTDPIQIYGGRDVTIRRNFFHDNDVSAAIMMADGGRDNVVEDNVVAAGGQTWAISWLADDGSVIRHNTFADGACDFGQRCGFINLGRKPGDEGGRPTIIRGNVMGGVSNGAGGGTARFVAEGNMTATPTPGDGNLTALPEYAGPQSAYRGYRLASGSPGRGGAGADPGIR